MTPRGDVREIVDKMLAADKVLVGETTWRALPGDKRCLRWRKPCAISGEVTEMELEVQAYPDEPQPKFRIVLIYQKAVWRLDYAKDEGHVNSLNRPSHLPLGPINEPHYHGWNDNCRFATRASLPSLLKNANVMPENVKAFDAAFRWFCGQTNITIGSLEMPRLPARATLI